jgi:hypothetical protein
VNGAIVAHHDALIFHRNHFARVAVAAHVRLKHVLADVNVGRIQIGQVPLHVALVYALQLVFFRHRALHLEEIIQYFGFVVSIADLLLVFKVIKNDFIVVQIIIFAPPLVLANGGPKVLYPFTQVVATTAFL